MGDARIFIPLNLDKTARGENFMSVVGRMKPGISLRQAQSEMDAIARALEKEYPVDNSEQGAIVIPMLSRVGLRVREALWIMLAAVGLVLLIYEFLADSKEHSAPHRILFFYENVELPLTASQTDDARTEDCECYRDFSPDPFLTSCGRLALQRSLGGTPLCMRSTVVRC